MHVLDGIAIIVAEQNPSGNRGWSHLAQGQSNREQRSRGIVAHRSARLVEVVVFRQRTGSDKAIARILVGRGQKRRSVTVRNAEIEVSPVDAQIISPLFEHGLLLRAHPQQTQAGHTIL